MPVCAGICLIISIHAPRMGSDDIAEYRHYLTLIFQSTLPGWGATCPAFVITRRTLIFQSTLPGWGATSTSLVTCVFCCIFQSTLPGWGATVVRMACTPFMSFQSTLPGWGATLGGAVMNGVNTISIHAPRMGSDSCTCLQYPVLSIFQSTLPGWGATYPQSWQSWLDG